jgi:hypothetical protein
VVSLFYGRYCKLSLLIVIALVNTEPLSLLMLIALPICQPLQGTTDGSCRCRLLVAVIVSDIFRSGNIATVLVSVGYLFEKMTCNV